ncbi:MAG: NOB1 family endonuclease [Archaeoglobaceae archaeon]|nr:NOB1 family endonuclease [Archaeoglobaceae archaeon]MCX8152543.1 NOB1 family endonuclease [Archaeoglobaceae archaeon]MDW8014036.1 NOB1 family endonuclease [Archaeoglobaceae archaeon]
MKVYVIDSAAIFKRKASYENMVTVPEVVSEVLDEGSEVYLEVKKLKVESATPESFEEVLRIAKKTGDIYKLSETDLKVLAKALDEKKKKKDVVLVTDDYSMQNIAMELGIIFESVVQKKIKSKVEWIKVCRGCGREVSSDVCPTCGSETVVRRLKR